MLSTFTIKYRWFFLFAVSGLMVATVFLLNSVDRFHIEIEQLLQDNTFSAGSGHWQEKGGNPAVFDATELKMTNKPGGSHSVFQNVKIDSSGHYQLTFEAGTQEVIPVGEATWKNANVVVIFRDKAQERIGSRMLLSLEGSHPLKAYSEIFPLKDILGSVDIAFRLYHSGGNFTIRNPVLSKLGEFSSFIFTKTLLTICWFLAAILAIHAIFSVIGNKQKVFLVAVGVIVLLGVLMPNNIMTELTQKIASVLPDESLSTARSMLGHLYGDQTFVHPGSEVSKIGHFLVFTVIGFFAGWFALSSGVAFSIVSVILFALSTEIVQMLVDGRSTRLDDFVLDCVGALLGFALGVMCVRLIHRNKQLVESQVQVDDDISSIKNSP